MSIAGLNTGLYAALYGVVALGVAPEIVAVVDCARGVPPRVLGWLPVATLDLPALLGEEA